MENATTTSSQIGLYVFLTGLLSFLLGRWLYDYFHGLKTPTNAEVKALAAIEGRVAHIEWRTTQMEAALIGKVDRAYYDLSIESVKSLFNANQEALALLRSELHDLRKIIVESDRRFKRHTTNVPE